MQDSRLCSGHALMHKDGLCGYSGLGVFAFSIVVYLFALYYRVGLEVADDGAFFLRYAENIISGNFWVWNEGEHPVWGASAPLYPLLIAVPIMLGVTPEQAIVATGMVVVALSFSWLVVILSARFGYVAGFSFLAFSAMDSGAMYFSVGGLETPLTFFLLVFAIWSILESKKLWLIGAIAGLLMVQKLDLVPIAGLLLLGLWVREKRMPLQAVLVAAIVGAAWYVFAWCYFGAPVPNSFLTKSLHQDNFNRIIDWTWFSKFVFFGGMHKWLVVLAISGVVINFKKNIPVLIVLVGTLVTHTVAYTVKYPFEPYNWYCMPSVFSLIMIASLGAYNIQQKLKEILPSAPMIGGGVVTLFIVSVIYGFYDVEAAVTASIKQFAGLHEHDRAEAGRWVNENTPKDFKVLTYWGNPAFYSGREVIDGSFLNRKYEEGNLVSKYRPEIIVLQNNPGSTPMAPIFAATDGKGYKVVKVFDETYRAGMDYFFAVLAREDVLDQLTGVSSPKNLYGLLSNITLGDLYGVVKVHSQHELFIHPGDTTPTVIFMDVEKFREDYKKSEVTVRLSISPLISQEAVARGAGNVRVSLFGNNEEMFSGVVSVDHPIVTSVKIEDLKDFKMVVDNNGGADTDWLIAAFD